MGRKIKKWTKGVGLSGVLILLPSAILRVPLCDVRIWILFTLTVTVIGTHPDTSFVKRDESTDDPRDRSSLTGIILAGYLCILGPLGHYFWHVHATGSYTKIGWLSLFGAVAGIFGMTLRVVAIRTLGLWFTADVRIQEGQSLIQRGAYRWLRHPSYTGSLLFLGSTPFLLALPAWVLLLWPVLFLAYRKRIRAEEETLGAQFGDAYSEYKKRSWALLPGVY